MLRSVLIAGAVVVLAAAGVVEGIFSNRWGPSDDLKAATARLDGVPRQVGPWTGTENPVAQKVLDWAEATGSVSRVYRNAKTGAEVSVLIICGPAGPIGAHTPEYCYGGLGYRMSGETRKTVATPDGATHSYWSGRFEKPTGEAGLQVCWAWGTGGDWVAADDPRLDFAGRTALYKLYVTRGLTAADREGKPGPDTVTEFLTDFLPEAKKALAPN